MKFMIPCELSKTNKRNEECWNGRLERKMGEKRTKALKQIKDSFGQYGALL
jgi:hypothetical protein